MSNGKKENLVIVGGGPSGLSAAIYAARAALGPLVIEGVPPGGQLMLTTEVENYPGFHKGILGPELISIFRQQAERFGTRFLTDKVLSVKPEGEYIHVQTANAQISARTVLVATGADAMWLGLASEQRLRGKGVSACATCDGFFFRDKVVGVVGGGDTAMEEANFLTKFVKKAYIIHRRDEFRASKIMQERALANPKVEAVYNAVVEEVLGEDKVTGVKLKIQNSKSKIQNLELDGLFIAIGHRPATEFLDGSGVELDRKGYVVTSERFAWDYAKSQIQNPNFKYNLDFKYMTSVEGIFAAGDCVDHVYRQAGTAVGMGIAAELEIEKWLEEKK